MGLFISEYAGFADELNNWQNESALPPNTSFDSAFRRPMRQLLAHEIPLVSHLFAAAGLPFDPDTLVVEPMSDGGMGSLALGAGYASRRMAREVAECHFVDKDQVWVSATLNVDQDGMPYEVDVWKVNFAPTIEWPASAQIRSGPLDTSLERTREG